MKGKEAANKLNIKTDTLRLWLRTFEGKLNLNKNNKGSYVLSQSDYDIITNIKSLREEDNGFKTIEKKLFDNNAITEKQHNNPVVVERLQNDNNIIKELEDKLINTLSDSLKTSENNINNNIQIGFNQLSILSEKLSNYSYKLGTLEAENKHLKEKQLLISFNQENQIEQLKKEYESKIKDIEHKNNVLITEIETLNESFLIKLWKRLKLR